MGISIYTDVKKTNGSEIYQFSRTKTYTLNVIENKQKGNYFRNIPFVSYSRLTLLLTPKMPNFAEKTPIPQSDVICTNVLNAQLPMHKFSPIKQSANEFSYFEMSLRNKRNSVIVKALELAISLFVLDNEHSYLVL